MKDVAKQNSEVVQFYDGLASQYDDMTARQKSSENLQQTLASFVRATKICSAVDVGCGTGWHAVLLAQMGLRVAGVDISEKMVAQAQTLAASFGAPVTWHVGDMTRLDKMVGPGWDAVLCLGNTLPHIRRMQELRRFFSAASRSLEEDGLLVVQCLNYELLQRRHERVVALTRSEDREFIRFNDYVSPNRVRFNLLEVDWTAEKPRYRLSHTLLRPWRPAVLEAVLQQAGFGNISVYNDLAFSPFDPDVARSFVMVAHQRRR